MSRDYDEDYDYDPPVRVVKRGGFFGKFIALLLGFILGVIASFGGIVGVVYYVGWKMQIKKAFSTVNQLAKTNLAYTDYITEDYASLSVVALVKELSEKFNLNANPDTSLQTLAEISPQITKLVDLIYSTAQEKNFNLEELGFNKAELISTPLKQFGTYVQTCVQEAQIATILDVFNIQKTSLLMSLCYGIENEDYVVDKESGEITMIGSATPLAVKDIWTKDSGFSTDKLLSKLSIESIMSFVGTVDYSDAAIRALLYGTRDKDYTYDEESNVLQMLPIAYAYDQTNGTITDNDGNLYTLDTLTGRFNCDGVGYITTENDIAGSSLVSTEDTNHYDYAVFTIDGNKLFDLMIEPSSNSFSVWKQGIRQIHHPRMLNSLTSDPMGTIKNLSLADLLGANADTDTIILALCYGSNGYEITSTGEGENKKNILTIKSDAKNTTIGDLMDGGIDAFTDISLASVINPTAETSPLLLSLCYGSDGYHITTEEQNGETVKILTIKDTAKITTIGDLKGDDPLSIFKDIALADVIGVNSDSQALLLSLCYGSDGYEITSTGEGENKKNILTIKEGAKITTIGDLMGDDPMSLFNDIAIADIISPTATSDSILLSLCYGSDGYRIDTQVINGETVKTLVVLTSSPATIQNLQDGNLINDIQLSSILKDVKHDDDISMYLLYGKKNVAYSINNDEVIMLPKRIALVQPNAYDEEGNDITSKVDFNAMTLTEGEKVYSITTDIFTDKYTDFEKSSNYNYYYVQESGETSYYLYAPRTVSDLSGDTLSGLKDDLTIGEMMSYDPSANNPKILTAIHSWKISDLSDPSKIDSLLLGDVIEIGEDANAVLKALADKPIGDLSTAIDDVPLTAVITPDPADKITMYLLYGVEGVDYTVDAENHISGTPRTIQDLSGANSPINTITNDLTIGDLIKYDSTASNPRILTAIHSWKISDFNDEGKINTLTLGEVIDVGDNKILQELENKEIGNLSTAINDVALTAVITPDPTDKITMYLLYGVEGVNYTVNGTEIVPITPPRTIGDLSGTNSPINTITNDLNIGDLMGYQAEQESSYAKILVAIHSWKIADLQDQNKIMSLKISNVIDIDDNSPSILKAMSDDPSTPDVDESWSLTDLNNPDKINSLTLIQVLGTENGIEDNIFLKHISNTRIDGIADAISGLYIQQVFTADVYKTVQSGENTYYVDKTNSTLNNVSELYFQTTAGIVNIYSDKECTIGFSPILTGQWKYLLTDKDTGKEEFYPVSDMGKLIDNMTANIQKASLNELKNDGILTFDDSFLTTAVISSVSIPSTTYPFTPTSHLLYEGNKQTFGEFTITELVDYVTHVIPALSELAS